MVVPYHKVDSHALLTRLPLSPKEPFDLHVLGLPPAFVLSQDQTLKLNEIFDRLWSLRIIDRVPSTLIIPSTLLSTEQLASLIKRSTAEVSFRSPGYPDKPQGHRRLRFSFFLFTCQTTDGTNRQSSKPIPTSSPSKPEGHQNPPAKRPNQRRLSIHQAMDRQAPK